MLAFGVTMSIVCLSVNALVDCSCVGWLYEEWTVCVPEVRVGRISDDGVSGGRISKRINNIDGFKEYMENQYLLNGSYSQMICIVMFEVRIVWISCCV